MVAKLPKKQKGLDNLLKLGYYGPTGEKDQGVKWFQLEKKYQKQASLCKKLSMSKKIQM